MLDYRQDVETEDTENVWKVNPKGEVSYPCYCGGTITLNKAGNLNCDLCRIYELKKERI